MRYSILGSAGLLLFYAMHDSRDALVIYLAIILSFIAAGGIERP
jgi:hypothetical protein